MQWMSRMRNIVLCLRRKSGWGWWGDVCVEVSWTRSGSGGGIPWRDWNMSTPFSPTSEEKVMRECCTVKPCCNVHTQESWLIALWRGRGLAECEIRNEKWWRAVSAAGTQEALKAGRRTDVLSQSILGWHEHQNWFSLFQVILFLFLPLFFCSWLIFLIIFLK